MDTHRMDQETVERLLDGSVPHGHDGLRMLVRLLAAVRAAPRPHELAGEAAAVRAFRMTYAVGGPVHPGPVRPRPGGVTTGPGQRPDPAA
ncbi:hypothetical protein [Micromonospora sp. NPDC093277]|uniref:hypothetical protein n=1 Tax=Micromonospora sp. NPDC093277 TaxID=3364291 RepID=UPI00382B37DD